MVDRGTKGFEYTHDPSEFLTASPRQGIAPGMVGSLTLLIHRLVLLNLALQLLDATATYHGLQIGVREANPIVRASIVHWGAGWALLYWKGFACALLVFLRFAPARPLVVKGLTVTAVCYVWLSFIPWLSIFVMGGIG